MNKSRVSTAGQVLILERLHNGKKEKRGMPVMFCARSNSSRGAFCSNCNTIDKGQEMTYLVGSIRTSHV
jgi:hypothetical protein